MTEYLVCYDLERPAPQQDDFTSKLEEIGGTRVQESVWLISPTNEKYESAEHLLEELLEYIRSDNVDRLTVVDLSKLTTDDIAMRKPIMPMGFGC